MRRGFTILEMLVASLLLGMLMTILTMLFNSSSVAWRTGSALVSDMDDVRDAIAQVREEADNAIPWNGSLYRFVSPWNDAGELRSRACESGGLGRIPSSLGSKDGDELRKDCASHQTSVGGVSKNGRYQAYVVNVMSGGPANDIMDWQAIWSFPDDFE